MRGYPKGFVPRKSSEGHMIEKLQEICGYVSGYKQKCDELQTELLAAKATLAEAEKIVDDILLVLHDENTE